MMPNTIYLFEARSIQTYLFEGGKLRDMIAASDQLDALCGAPFDEVLQSLDLAENRNIHFPRRNGGSIYAILDSKEDADKLQALWSLYVRTNMPGVEVVQVIEESSGDLMETMDAAIKRLAEQRNLMSAQFPVPGPLVRRSPRTGKAAVAPFLYARQEWVDEATHIKANYHQKATNSGLVKKFAPDVDSDCWPTNLELEDGDFPFIGQDRGIALIHADGNGLGELLRALNKAIRDNNADYTATFQQFSKGMKEACEAAAQIASKELLAARKGENGIIPARPLVLGGDDLTIMVRADLAIPFTKRFCQEFERQTAKQFTPLFDKINVPDELKTLTACAGICFIKANQPFAHAYHLAESLCELAKKQSRLWREGKQGIIPSSISFHQVSSALIEDAKSVQKHEWEVCFAGQEHELSLGCYGLQEGHNPLATLELMAGLFGESGLNRNALREVASLIKVDEGLALKRYKRWRDVSAEKTATSKLLDEFDQYLSKLCSHQGATHQNPLKQLFGSDNKSPLVDLLALTALPVTPMQEAQP